MYDIAHMHVKYFFFQQCKCPVDSADLLGRTALHDAGVWIFLFLNYIYIYFINISFKVCADSLVSKCADM